MHAHTHAYMTSITTPQKIAHTYRLQHKHVCKHKHKHAHKHTHTHAHTHKHTHTHTHTHTYNTHTYAHTQTCLPFWQASPPHRKSHTHVP